MIVSLVSTLALLPPRALPPSSVGDELASAQAVAAYELAWWRRNHPKADLSITFSSPSITPSLASLVRTRLGFKNETAVLDANVLTIVFDSVSRQDKRRLQAEAFVFLGSFPKGFHARYQIQDGGKKGMKVLSRAVLDRYDIGRPAKNDT